MGECLIEFGHDCRCPDCLKAEDATVASERWDDLRARLAAAEARAEKAEGEVAYLRELRDWSRECARRARAADRPGKERAYMEWLELHSPPTPPPGVKP